MAVQDRLEVVSTDYEALVYKVDNPVQSYLLSSLVLTLIQSSIHLSQIRYSLVVILELNGISEIQYKEVMMSSINKDN